LPHRAMLVNTVLQRRFSASNGCNISGRIFTPAKNPLQRILTDPP